MWNTFLNSVEDVRCWHCWSV